jgi:hypothetical protein
VEIKLIFPETKNQGLPLDNIFVASETPFFIGIIVKPSKKSWMHFKKSREVMLSGRREAVFYVKFNIDVGENTIFFLSPVDGKLTSAEFLN